jgi:hypothetical protein
MQCMTCIVCRVIMVPLAWMKCMTLLNADGGKIRAGVSLHGLSVFTVLLAEVTLLVPVLWVAVSTLDVHIFRSGSIWSPA